MDPLISSVINWVNMKKKSCDNFIKQSKSAYTSVYSDKNIWRGREVVSFRAKSSVWRPAWSKSKATWIWNFEFNIFPILSRSLDKVIFWGACQPGWFCDRFCGSQDLKVVSDISLIQWKIWKRIKCKSLLSMRIKRITQSAFWALGQIN